MESSPVESVRRAGLGPVDPGPKEGVWEEGVWGGRSMHTTASIGLLEQNTDIHIRT